MQSWKKQQNLTHQSIKRAKEISVVELEKDQERNVYEAERLGKSEMAYVEMDYEWCVRGIVSRRDFLSTDRDYTKNIPAENGNHCAVGVAHRKQLKKFESQRPLCETAASTAFSSAPPATIRVRVRR